MFNRVLDCLINLCNTLTSNHSTSIDTKLESIDERLKRLESRLNRDRQFAFFTFLLMAGFGVIAVGLGIRLEQPKDGILLMVLGLGLLFLAPIGVLISKKR